MPQRHVLERVIKRRITAYLLSLQMPNSGVECYVRMPVPGGYGWSGLDYEGCIRGLFFAIEAKSPDNDADLTPRQRACAEKIVRSGGKVFIISGDEGLLAFKRWVEKCCKA